MTPELIAEGAHGDEAALYYDESDERYLLTLYLSGYEVEMPFVAVDLSMDGRIHLLRRRQLGTHASGDTLEGTPAEWGEVGEALERIAAGEHPEVVAHA